MATIVTASELRRDFARYMEKVAHEDERIIVTRSGRHLVAIIDVDALAALEEMEDRLDILEAEEILRTNDPSKNVSVDDVLRRILAKDD